MTNLPHVLNWRRINARITTSGQPTEDQLAEIQGFGVTRISNPDAAGCTNRYAGDDY